MPLIYCPLARDLALLAVYPKVEPVRANTSNGANAYIGDVAVKIGDVPDSPALRRCCTQLGHRLLFC
jgi:hypothetical protein